MSLRSLVAAAVIVAALPLATAATFTVTASNFAWTPSNLVIAPGDSVTFVNGAGTHNWRSSTGLPGCELPCTKTYPTAGTFGYFCGIHPGMTGVVQVGALPVVTIATPSAGASVQGVFATDGAASHETQAVSKVEVRLGTLPFRLATLDGSGTSVTWSTTIDTASVANGAYPLVAKVTTASGSTATTTRTVNVANPPRFDVELAQFVGGTTPASTPTRTTITAFYKNNGNEASGPLTIRFEYLYKDAWRPIGDFVRPSIPATTQTHSFAVVWDSGGFLLGQFVVRATLDPSDAIAETDEANNARTALATFVSPAIPQQDVRDPDASP